MVSYNLRRFSNPEAIRSIDRNRPVVSLGFHSEFLEKRGVRLSAPYKQNGFDLIHPLHEQNCLLDVWH